MTIHVDAVRLEEHLARHLEDRWSWREARGVLAKLRACCTVSTGGGPVVDRSEPRYVERARVPRSTMLATVSAGALRAQGLEQAHLSNLVGMIQRGEFDLGADHHQEAVHAWGILEEAEWDRADWKSLDRFIDLVWIFVGVAIFVAGWRAGG